MFLSEDSSKKDHNLSPQSLTFSNLRMFSNYVPSKHNSSFHTCLNEEKNLENQNPFDRGISGSFSMAIYNENIQYKMLSNYVKLLLFLNFIPLVGYCFSNVYYQWYSITMGTDSFWVNLIYIYDVKHDQIYGIQSFIESACWEYLQSNPKMSCEHFNVFKVTGGITFSFMIIAASMHLMHICQLVIILLKKYQLLQHWFCIKLKTLQVSVFILYNGGIFIWFVFILISQRTFSNYGISFFFALGSTIFYSGVFCYFVRIKKVLKEKKMINNLLDPDKLINRESSVHVN